MEPLYISNVPIPEQPELDAHFQELQTLQQAFGGSIVSAFPLKRPASWLPRSFYGLVNRRELKRLGAKASVVHVFSPGYYPYRYLSFFKDTPVIYSAQTPIAEKVVLPSSIDHLMVYDERSLDTLRPVYGERISLSPAHVDMKKQELGEPSGPFTLLMASAPWEEAQFETKGVHLLIDLIKRHEDMRMIFLWRNLLYKTMKKLVAESGCADRIEVINEKVDVKQYIERAHAVVLLSKHASLVKSYPHSLMEALLCGRPVILSDSIPMSSMVRGEEYGEVVDAFTMRALDQAVTHVRQNYTALRHRIATMDGNRFSVDRFLSVHREVYESVTSSEYPDRKG